jgi:hypothetical protein
MSGVVAAFRRFPTEAAIIGRLLAGYADLEIALMHCAQVVRDEAGQPQEPWAKCGSTNRRCDPTIQVQDGTVAISRPSPDWPYGVEYA